MMSVSTTMQSACWGKLSRDVIAGLTQALEAPYPCPWNVCVPLAFATSRCSLKDTTLR